jgi:hypothetical protein
MVFENFDQWRKHPKLHQSMRNPRYWKHLWPGAGIGTGLFIIYLGLEKYGIIESDNGHHHGSHGHDDNHDNSKSH